MFEAIGTYTTMEKDMFENGCDPDTTQTFDNNNKFSAESLEDLFKNIASHFDVELSNISVNNIGDDADQNVVVVSRHETAYGERPSASSLNKWKNNKIALWLVDYSFNIVETNKVDFSKMSTAAITLKYGISS